MNREIIALVGAASLWPVAARTQQEAMPVIGFFVERLWVISPIFVPGALPFRNPEHRALLLSALRRAAGEAK